MTNHTSGGFDGENQRDRGCKAVQVEVGDDSRICIQRTLAGRVFKNQGKCPQYDFWCGEINEPITKIPRLLTFTTRAKALPNHHTSELGAVEVILKPVGYGQLATHTRL
jgi:hypothetical protein